jgi:hypothetical protein
MRYQNLVNVFFIKINNQNLQVEEIIHILLPGVKVAPVSIGYRLDDLGLVPGRTGSFSSSRGGSKLLRHHHHYQYLQGLGQLVRSETVVKSTCHVSSIFSALEQWVASPMLGV